MQSFIVDPLCETLQQNKKILPADIESVMRGFMRSFGVIIPHTVGFYIEGQLAGDELNDARSLLSGWIEANFVLFGSGEMHEIRTLMLCSDPCGYTTVHLAPALELEDEFDLTVDGYYLKKLRALAVDQSYLSMLDY